MILMGRRVVRDGCELRDRHLETAVAADGKHQLVGPGELRTDRGRQAEAHGAEAAGVEPETGLIESDELRGPHLVLADVGRYEGLAARKAGRFRP